MVELVAREAGYTAVDLPPGPLMRKPLQGAGQELPRLLRELGERAGWHYLTDPDGVLRAYTVDLRRDPSPADHVWPVDELLERPRIEPPSDVPSRWIVRVETPALAGMPIASDFYDVEDVPTPPCIADAYLGIYNLFTGEGFLRELTGVGLVGFDSTGAGCSQLFATIDPRPITFGSGPGAAVFAPILASTTHVMMVLGGLADATTSRQKTIASVDMTSGQIVAEITPPRPHGAYVAKGPDVYWLEVDHVGAAADATWSLMRAPIADVSTATVEATATLPVEEIVRISGDTVIGLHFSNDVTGGFLADSIYQADLRIEYDGVSAINAPKRVVRIDVGQGLVMIDPITDFRSGVGVDGNLVVGTSGSLASRRGVDRSFTDVWTATGLADVSGRIVWTRQLVGDQLYAALGPEVFSTVGLGNLRFGSILESTPTITELEITPPPTLADEIELRGMFRMAGGAP